MRICGVELKGGEAVVCLLAYEKGAFTLPDCRQRLFTVSPSVATDSIRDFYSSFRKLMQDYSVEQLIIIGREQKGKLAGSATSFKLEAALQLLEIPVDLISQSDIKEQLKLNPLQADFEELGLKKFQRSAFQAAYAYQQQQLHK